MESDPCPPADAAETPPPRRAPGRPATRSAAETRQLLLNAAAAEFFTVGVGQASMARIAQRAGISTKTLYKVAAGKDDLFQTVVEQRISQVVAGFSRRAAGDLHDQVAGLAIDYARFVLSPEAIATMRILLEEQARFPALGARFVESTAQVAEAFDGALTEVLPPEAVPGGDLGFFARLFRLTILGEQREQLVKRSPPMGETAIAAFASRVVAVLLPR